MEGCGTVNVQGTEWVQIVKQSLFSDMKFTADMKAAVIERVYQSKPFSGFSKRAMTFVPVMATVSIVIGALFLTGSLDSIFEKSGDAVSEYPITYSPLDARSLQPGEITLVTDSDVLPGLSNKHNPLQKQAVEHVLSLTDIELIDSKEINGFGTLLYYTLLVDDPVDAAIPKGTRYFGFNLSGLSEPQTVFHAGFGNMYDMANHRMTAIFGHSALKVDQKDCRIDGESCAWYYTIEHEKPMLYAMFSAKSYERDLDGDGIEEIIVTTMKQNQIYIFKEENSQLYWASIREITNSAPGDLITYHEDEGTISITSFFGGLRTTRKFSYTSDGNKLTQISESVQLE